MRPMLLIIRVVSRYYWLLQIVETREIIFDGRVFSVDAVKNAAYRLADVLDTEVRLDGDQIVCKVKLRKQDTNEVMNGVLERLRREVVDHDLRLQIRKETEATRNLILAHAFSRTGIVSSE
jgi:His-Xaa-Ser system protein HxsD